MILLIYIFQCEGWEFQLIYVYNTRIHISCAPVIPKTFNPWISAPRKNLSQQMELSVKETELSIDVSFADIRSNKQTVPSSYFLPGDGLEHSSSGPAPDISAHAMLNTCSNCQQQLKCNVFVGHNAMKNLLWCVDGVYWCGVHIGGLQDCGSVAWRRRINLFMYSMAKCIEVNKPW